MYIYVTDQAMELGVRLRQLREQQGISRKALADSVKVSPETIRKIEEGITQSPGIYLFYNLASKLKVTPDYLAFGQELKRGSNQQFTISQNQESLIQVDLPYQVTLDDKTRTELTRRVAFELEIIWERQHRKENEDS